MYWKPFLTTLSLLCLLCVGCADHNRDAIGKTEVVIETSRGKITLRLYDDTPLHRDNFVRMIQEGVYDGIVWNRIVPEGTIQSGDPSLRADGRPTTLDVEKYKHTVPAEIRYPRYFHKAGALAMARQPDSININRESSGTQFYIVTGKKYNRVELGALWQFRKDYEPGFAHPRPSELQKQTYAAFGGTPHLDGDYTIFGEVVDGMQVVESIGRIPVDAHERPLKNVFIKRIYVND